MTNDVLRTYIDSLGLFTTCGVDFLGQGNSLALRHDPGSATEQRFFDGTREGSFNFSMLVKNESLETCLQTMNALTEALDLRDFVIENEFVTCYPVSQPVPIEETDDGFVYTCSFRLEYITRG